MGAKSMGCRLWQQRARRGAALGLRHCRQSRVNQKRSITAFTPPHLLKRGTNVGYCRFAPERVIHPLRNHVVLQRVTALNERNNTQKHLGQLYGKHASGFEQLVTMKLLAQC